MELGDLFQIVVKKISAMHLEFALVGDLAATLYRKEKRFTGDVDFAIKSIGRNEKILAEQIIASLGFKSHVVRKAELEGGPLFAIKRKSTEVYIIVGRDPNNKESAGVDFLLPSIPWVSNAISRARFNSIDYGFGALPTITVEDVLIAKFYALNSSQSRPKDEDDVLSILDANHDLDYQYLSALMRTYALTVSKNLIKRVPEIIRKISKGVERDRRVLLRKK